MAKSTRIIPSWVRSLGAMLDEGFDDCGRTNVHVKVNCTKCRCGREIDLVALCARVGREYSLLNRRCRCRMTADCPGWNRFYYAWGRSTWTRMLVEDRVYDRWLGDL